MVNAHEIDLAIMGTPPRGLRTNAARFARHPMGFVASTGHALMTKKKLNLADLLAAGLGVGFLSVHPCALEFQAGLLRLLPMPGNPVEAEWQVMHLANQPIPKVAAAFQDHVSEHGRALVTRELERF